MSLPINRAQTVELQNCRGECVQRFKREISETRVSDRDISELYEEGGCCWASFKGFVVAKGMDGGELKKKGVEHFMDCCEANFGPYNATILELKKEIRQAVSDFFGTRTSGVLPDPGSSNRFRNDAGESEGSELLLNEDRYGTFGSAE